MPLGGMRDNCRYIYVSNPKCRSEKVDKPHNSHLNSSNTYCYVWHFVPVKHLLIKINHVNKNLYNHNAA